MIVKTSVFLTLMQRVEAQEREDALSGFVTKAVKGKVGKPKMKRMQLEETLPSIYGRRIEPVITLALKADGTKKLLKKKGKVSSQLIKGTFGVYCKVSVIHLQMLLNGLHCKHGIIAIGI